MKNINQHQQKKKKGYNTWDSRVVTNLSTNPASQCLASLFGTGSGAFTVVWPYPLISPSYQLFIPSYLLFFFFFFFFPPYPLLIPSFFFFFFFFSFSPSYPLLMPSYLLDCVSLCYQPTPNKFICI